MGISTKDLLNAGLRSVLAAGEHHWAGKAIGTFVSEVAGAWKGLPDEQRVALSEAGEAELVEAFDSAGLASRRSGLAAAGPEAVEELSLVLRDEVGPHLTAFEADVAGRVEIVLRQLAPRFQELAGNLHRVAGHESELLDLRRELVGHLFPLDSWQDAYWERLRRGVPLGHLIEALGDAGFARLRDGMVGRDSELAHFQRFLASPDGATVLYHSGNPGCGKSRLAIEYARLARADGWPVFFVSGRSDVMISTWLRELRAESKVDRLLLIWDDWQGDREQQLRDFLALEDDPLLTGFDVRRVLTTWPSFRRAVLEARSVAAPLLDRPLPPLGDEDGGEAAVADFVAAVLPEEHRPDREALETVVRLAEGYPMALLLGVDLLVGGESGDDLAGLTGLTGPAGIVGRSYSRHLGRLRDRLGAEGVSAYRRLAMIGEATVDNLRAEGVDDRLPGFAEHRRELCQHGFVAFDEERSAYRVEPDLLRRYVAESSLGGRPDDPLWLEAPVAGWAEAAEPFLPLWASEIWSITTLALDGDERAAELKGALLRAIDGAIESRLPEAWERRHRWAEGVFMAGVAEPEPGMRADLAERIGAVARASPAPDLVFDRGWARGLYNATVGATAEERLRIAALIESVSSRHSPPDRAIDLEEVQALFNATAVESSSEERLRIASLIESVSSRHSPPDGAIDLAWAKVLFNATIPTSSSEECLGIASLIESVSLRHTPPNRLIDLRWAKALMNATVQASSSEERLRIASSIESVASHHSPPDREIDLEWAKALMNATAVASSSEECLRIAALLETVSSRHSPPDREIALAWAGALYNTAAVEWDPERVRYLAERIRSIGAGHAPERAPFDEIELVTWLCGWEALDGEEARRELEESRIAPLVASLASHPDQLEKVRDWWERINGDLRPLPDTVE